MNKKGMTLVEIIVAISLISVVMIFLFQVLITVINGNKRNNTKSQTLISKAIVMKAVEHDLDTFGLQDNTSVKECGDFDGISDSAKNQIIPIAARSNDYYCIKITYNPSNVKNSEGYLIFYQNNEKGFLAYKRGKTTDQGFIIESQVIREIDAIPKALEDGNSDLISFKGDSNLLSLNVHIPILASDGNNYDLALSYISGENIDLPYNNVKEFSFTGNEQEYIVALDGNYKIEAWGAQGGGSTGGKGAYSSGVIRLVKGEVLKVYVGGAGNSTGAGGYNGGGNAGVLVTNNDGGGGATDVRFANNTINDRILVAAGGGGANANGSNTAGIGITGGAGGGLEGYQGSSTIVKMSGTGGTQVSGGIRGNTSRSPGTNGNFYSGGVGTASKSTPTVSGGSGGGAGYYGGGSGEGCSSRCGGSAGGGSSYISGHTGCVAILSSSSTTARTGTGGASCITGTNDNLCSVHYSGKFFTDTVMIDGTGYSWTNIKGVQKQMPNPSGGYYANGVGQSGNGYARITYVS